MTEREARIETRVIWATVILIVTMIALALYGYLTGAWERAESNSGAMIEIGATPG
jgi:hypothetical protein